MSEHWKSGVFSKGLGKSGLKVSQVRYAKVCKTGSVSDKSSLLSVSSQWQLIVLKSRPHTNSSWRPQNLKQITKFENNIALSLRACSSSDDCKGYMANSEEMLSDYVKLTHPWWWLKIIPCIKGGKDFSTHGRYPFSTSGCNYPIVPKVLFCTLNWRVYLFYYK